MTGIFEGFTVVEIGGEMAAPIAGMLLADNGARVIKVECPGGDPYRALPGARVWNRGKQSLTLDLRQPAARGALERLLGRSDVLATQMGVEELAALRLREGDLRPRFPALVVCNITGYGVDGRDSARPGYEGLVASRMGLHWMPPGGARGHQVLSRPRYMGWPVASYSTAILAVLGVASALYLRQRTGKGQGVDVSLKDGVLAMGTMGWARAEKGPPASAMGSGMYRRRLLVAPFQCQDGEWLHLHTGAVGAFERLMEAVGLPQYMSRPFAGEEEWAEMVRQVEEGFLSGPREQWLAALDRHDVPALPILRLGEALHDEQSRVMGFAQEVSDPELGGLLEAGLALVFERTPGRIRGSWPLVGEHTGELLEEIGLSEQEMTALRAGGLA